MKLATALIDGETYVVRVDTDAGQVFPFTGVSSLLHLIQGVKPCAETAPVALSSVTLLAPIPTPLRNLFCIGWNYLAHFDEGRDARPDVKLPDYPSVFTKATTSVIGPFDALPLHAAHTEKLDWEAELAVVIGRKGRDISEADAMSYVFGYMVANDVSARDVQMRHGGQFFRGKSLDGTCPLGPWIVTADEIDPSALAISCRVNGEIMQSASTRQMIFPIARVIKELSEGLTLLPGDIILTGTPEGVGNSRKPPLYLKAGDVLETEIAGIGGLRNVVTA